MAGKYDIKFTPKAEEDLDFIYEYITIKLFANLAVEKLMAHIESSIMNLSEFPLSCPLIRDDFLKAKGYRKLLVDNYIVFYLVDNVEKQVVIMRILFGASDYQNIL